MASLNELNRQANELKAAGKIEEALSAFRAIVDVAPANPVCMHNLGAALADAGRDKEAVEWAERAIKAGITAPETFLMLARSSAAVGRMEESKAAFQEALRRRPADPPAQKEYAQLIWMLTGDRAAALQTLNEAVERHPQVLDLRIVRAQVIGQTGDVKAEYEEVLEALKRGGAAHPFLQLAAANSALATEQFAAALAHARAAAAGKPDEPLITHALARTLLANGETVEASRIASRLRAQFPLDQGYIALQATCWRLLGDERYHSVYDYDRFVAGFPLACPPGWSSAESYVDDLVAALDRHHSYKTHPFGQSVRRGGQLPSIDKIDDPVLKAVGEAVRGPIESYIARIGAGPDPLRMRNRGGYRLFSTWSVRLASTGYHINHVHPQGWLSSACHLRFPTSKDESDRSGWITFGGPGLRTRPELTAERFVRPQKGVMVVFPSYMWHGTVPFEGETTRLSIAADSVPASA